MVAAKEKPEPREHWWLVVDRTGLVINTCYTRKQARWWIDFHSGPLGRMKVVKVTPATRDYASIMNF